MKNTIPEISKQINKEDIFNVLESKYSTLGPIWVSHQIEWFNGVYSAFKDHDKFLILIFLTQKTLNFYAINFIKLSYDEYFSSDTIEIEKFNITEIANALHIPKESARRKIIELEHEGVIKRIKKKIIIDRSSFSYSKPIQSIKRVSTFFSALATICNKEKILSKRITSEELELVIKNNFTHVWNLYFKMQIPMFANYKFFFGDFETFHIFGACVVSQHFHAKKISELSTSRVNFMKNNLLHRKIQGINAMSISEITGIPRATVIRKLQKLIKVGNLTIDIKKHYTLTGDFTKKLMPLQKDALNKLANFSAEIYNLVILNEIQRSKNPKAPLASFSLKSV